MGFDIDWEGNGIDEKGIDSSTGKQIIGINPKFFRPTEVNTLLGDASKAKRLLGWESRTSFSDLVEEMVVKDLMEVEKNVRQIHLNEY